MREVDIVGIPNVPWSEVPPETLNDMHEMNGHHVECSFYGDNPVCISDVTGTVTVPTRET